MQEAIIKKYMDDNMRMYTPRPIPDDDPRNISRWTAPISPPHTKDIAAAQSSRFASR